ncbi:hypothetical protein [Paenibacillus dendritiformis]|nr:hypothetical protein [Paenibacillus dendritiformis]
MNISYFAYRIQYILEARLAEERLSAALAGAPADRDKQEAGNFTAKK